MKRLILIALIPAMVGCAGMTKQLIRRYYALKERYHYADKPEDASSWSSTPRGEVDYVDGSWPDAKKSSGENGD